MKFGLLGEKLGHSYSPQIHAFLGDYPYPLFEKPLEAVGDFLNNGDFDGLNVTIPYKKTAMPYCAELSDRAEALGCVNTIVRRPDGSLYGHNTDFFGFESMVHHSGLDVAGKKALVLGSGGSSNTAVAVLKHLGAQVVMISRSGENNYQNLHLHADARIIVNTTPVGMYPNTGVSPINLDLFPQLEGVLDLIYNPSRTRLLLDAEEKGLINSNGLYMLVAQAWESAQYFTGKPLNPQLIDQIHKKLRTQMENIVLIGMPGSGKTTIGKLLAEKTGKHFIDADEEIMKAAGKSIPQIFKEDGEEAFRALETDVLKELGKQSGLVIATGGGCVTKEENYPSLHQNGKIFCMKRSLEALATDGRPLSQMASLQAMYDLRKPMYDRFADYRIENNVSAEEAAAEILRIWEELP